MNESILVVVAHPDDEVLGCGGTIARHVSEGDKVYVAIMADGVGSRPNVRSKQVHQRIKARDEAMQILGVTDFYPNDFPDNRMDTVPLLEVTQVLEAIISKIRPKRIYTHHHGDLNVDHRITHQAVMTACRPVPGTSVSEILTFEVLSSTEWATPGVASFLPNFYVDISKHLNTKLKALEAYKIEMRDTPHSRSVEHCKWLAQHRGNCVGISHAESFNLIRSVI